jgi:hypothetical protein
MVKSGYLANPISQSLIVASGVLLQQTISSLATCETAMEKQNKQQNQQNAIEQRLFLKTRNRNIRSTGKQSTAKAEEGYCNEATQSRPLTHSQSHQAQHTAEHEEVKHRQAWTKEEIREVIWCYMYCRQHFTGNYKKMYEIWRRHNPECRIYMDAKKLMNQKNYIIKHNKIMEMEIEEIKRELQASQRSHQEQKGKGELEHLGTMGDGEQQPSAVFTTEEEMEIHQHREQINKLRRNTESTYYQVTQMAIDNRPRLQKLHNMSKRKVIMIMAKEAM